MTDVSALPTLEAANVEPTYIEAEHASTTLALTQQVLPILQEQHDYNVSQIKKGLDPNGIMNRGKIFDL